MSLMEKTMRDVIDQNDLLGRTVTILEVKQFLSWVSAFIAE